MNNNEQHGVLNAIAKFFALLAAKSIKLTAFLCLYISPLVLVVSNYFYVKSIIFAEKTPEAGIIDNRYFIIFLFLITMLIIDVLFIINDGIDKLFYNISKLPQSSGCGCKERVNENADSKSFDLNDIKFKYNNSDTENHFLTIAFRINMDIINSLTFKVLFENDIIKRLFSEIEIERRDDVVLIEFLLKDKEIKKDEKKMNKIFNSMISICIFGISEYSTPSFAFKFDKEKYTNEK